LSRAKLCKDQDAQASFVVALSTANQHIAAAKQALGAQTTAAAIVEAIKLSLLEIGLIIDAIEPSLELLLSFSTSATMSSARQAVVRGATNNFEH
jgi:hypothetical protein